MQIYQATVSSLSSGMNSSDGCEKLRIGMCDICRNGGTGSNNGNLNGDGPFYIAPAVAYSGNGNNNGERCPAALPYLSTRQRIPCLLVYTEVEVALAFPVYSCCQQT